MVRHILDGARWFLALFDPPPLESMNFKQKICRVCFVSISLILSCVPLAMVLAVAFYVEEKGRRMLLDTPHMISGLVIIFIGIVVNTGCVLVLFCIRRMDAQLMDEHKSNNS